MASLKIRWLGMALMAVAVLLMPGYGPGVATADYDFPHWLPAGHSMPKGFKMTSCCYGLHLQQDCNLVLYPKDELDRPLWASDTAGKASDCNLIMQDDCNAVIYETGTQNALWASQTAGRGNDCDFWMQDDGNVVIYGDDGEAKWSTNTVVHT